MVGELRFFNKEFFPYAWGRENMRNKIRKK
jgi:hypothetical protein